MESTTKLDIECPPSPVKKLAVPEHSLEREESRQDLAIWMVLGGGMSMTAYALCVMWVIQDYAHYVFWLGMAAMANIFVLFGAIAGLLVKRTINISKTGIIYEDYAGDKPC